MRPGEERQAWQKAAERFDSKEHELRMLLEELMREAEDNNGEEPRGD